VTQQLTQHTAAAAALRSLLLQLLLPQCRQQAHVMHFFAHAALNKLLLALLLYVSCLPLPFHLPSSPPPPLLLLLLETAVQQAAHPAHLDQPLALPAAAHCTAQLQHLHCHPTPSQHQTLLLLVHHSLV
jgi:hypothetical protein